MTENNAIWPKTIIQNNFDDPLLLSEMEGGSRTFISDFTSTCMFLYIPMNIFDRLVVLKVWEATYTCW